MKIGKQSARFAYWYCLIVILGAIDRIAVGGDLEIGGNIKVSNGDEPHIELNSTVDPNSYLTVEDTHERGAKIEKVTQISNEAHLDFDVRNGNGTDQSHANAFYRFFRGTKTDGFKRIEFHGGTGAPNVVGKIVVTDTSCSFMPFGPNSKTSIGTDEPAAALHVASYTEAVDLINNGDFAADPESTWDWDYPEHVCYGCGPSETLEFNTDDEYGTEHIELEQALTTTSITGLRAGMSYTLHYEIVDGYDMTVTPKLGGTAGQARVLDGSDSFTEQIIAGSSNEKLIFEFDGHYGYCAIDNISLVADSGNVSGYFNGAVVASGFVDTTPGWEGTPQEALDQVLRIGSTDGHIDHASLPEFAVLRTPKVKYIDRTFATRAAAEAWAATQDLLEKPTYDQGTFTVHKAATEESQGQLVELGGRLVEEQTVEQCRVQVMVQDGESDYRNLGAMVTLYGESIKALKAENDALRTRLELLEARAGAQ